MGGDFAMYVPSHYLRQLPDINSIIVAKDAFSMQNFWSLSIMIRFYQEISKIH